ncbi:MAG: acetyl/propionyl/methylcrotonyl-CoA carboxylase subunit alpha [Pseudomonadota bacterium]
MFGRILIANRGEIACRIAQTARRLGIATVAVYSQADRACPHVMASDEAVEIGPPPAAESYLRSDRIVEAALATGAEAVHPGYGFLSENPEFAEAVTAAGLTWIGPPASAIRAMGLKDAAKRLMEAAGVPVTPGYHGAEQDPVFLAERAAEIGYPVLIKASAGGGGKGMRRVDHAADFADALTRAQSEAERAFANRHVLVEKFILNPRHIEVQVFGDRHGNIVHLFERDCSAQRRHQKVIEEAPAPGMTHALRVAMTGAATKAAEVVGYQGAGTVEFIVDGARMTPDGFYFMEMNTRLQVEHPVTETVTGLDLVEWQLRVAAGERLPLLQGEIALSGHAVEARIYAEDPARDFVPQTGRIERLRLPDTVRIDAGVAEGDAISPHYDPMIAKLVAHGPSREAAFGRLGKALDATDVAPLVTNIAYLAQLVRDPDMLAGRVDTGLVARQHAALIATAGPSALDVGVAAVAAAGLMTPAPLAGWRAWGTAATHLTLAFGERLLPVSVSMDGDGYVCESASGAALFSILTARDGSHRIRSGDQTLSMTILPEDAAITLLRAGTRHRFEIRDPLSITQTAGLGSDEICSPLPGMVQSVLVAAGENVVEGQPLAVMEAMKMEHILRAPRDGVVATVAASAGGQVAEGLVLITLRPEEVA